MCYLLILEYQGTQDLRTNLQTTPNDQINLRELFLLCNLTEWEPFFNRAIPPLNETFITIYPIDIHVT